MSFWAHAMMGMFYPSNSNRYYHDRVKINNNSY